MQIGADDLVRLFVGVGEIAGRLFLRNAVRKIGKGINIRFPVLFFAFGKIDGAPSTRAGVPVLNRLTLNPNEMRFSVSKFAGANPLGPELCLVSPTTISPLR